MTKSQAALLVLIGVIVGIALQPTITEGMTQFGRMFVTGNALLAAGLVAVALWWRFRT